MGNCASSDTRSMSSDAPKDPAQFLVLAAPHAALRMGVPTKLSASAAAIKSVSMLQAQRHVVETYARNRFDVLAREAEHHDSSMTPVIRRSSTSLSGSAASAHSTMAAASPPTLSKRALARSQPGASLCENPLTLATAGEDASRRSSDACCMPSNVATTGSVGNSTSMPTVLIPAASSVPGDGIVRVRPAAVVIRATNQSPGTHRATLEASVASWLDDQPEAPGLIGFGEASDW